MSISLIQQAGNSATGLLTGATLAATLGAAPTDGDLLIVSLGANTSTGRISSVSGGSTNGWTIDASGIVAYAPNVKGGTATITVTVEHTTGVGQNFTLQVSQWRSSVGPWISPLDVRADAINGASSATIDPTDITPTAANRLIFAFLSISVVARTVSTAAGWTALDNVTGTQTELQCQYKLDHAASAVTQTFAITGGNSAWGAQLLAFKEPTKVESTVEAEWNVAGPAVTLEPGRTASTNQSFAPTLVAGASAATVNPGFTASANQSFAPSVAPGAVPAQPGFTASANQSFAPAITAGAVPVQPGFTPSTNQSFAPTLTRGAVNLQPGYTPSASQSFGVTVQPGVPEGTLAPGFTASTSQSFAVSVVAGQVTLQPGFTPSASQSFAPTLVPGLAGGTVSPGFTASTSQSFGFSFAPGAVVLTPGFTASGNQSFTPTFGVPAALQPGHTTSANQSFSPQFRKAGWQPLPPASSAPWTPHPSPTGAWASV